MIGSQTWSRCTVAALLELARTPGPDPVPLAELSRRCSLPPHALERRLAILRAAGITSVQRGARGGHQLARDPERITMLEVVEVLDGPLQVANQGALKNAVRAAEDVLSRTTLADASRDRGISPERSRTRRHPAAATGRGEPDRAGSRVAPSQAEVLTPREIDVLRRLAQGKVYKQIARELSLTTSTVRAHLHHIYLKLGVVDRAQAVLLASDRGWL